MRRVCLKGPLARTRLLHLEGVQTKNSTVLKKLMGLRVIRYTGEKNKYGQGSCTLLLNSTRWMLRHCCWTAVQSKVCYCGVGYMKSWWVFHRLVSSFNTVHWCRIVPIKFCPYFSLRVSELTFECPEDPDLLPYMAGPLFPQVSP